MAALDRPSAMSESTSRSRGVSTERESDRRVAPEELGDDLGVEGGTSRRRPARAPRRSR